MEMVISNHFWCRDVASSLKQPPAKNSCLGVPRVILQLVGKPPTQQQKGTHGTKKRRFRYPLPCFAWCFWYGFCWVFRPKKTSGNAQAAISQTPTVFWSPETVTTPSETRTHKKVTLLECDGAWFPPRLLNEAAEAVRFFFTVSWFLVLDQSCGWWSKFVKILVVLELP